MAPLLALGDKAHPNFETATAANNQVPFLQALPLEIRILIYEYAVYEDVPIAPRQLATRSNKFRCMTGNQFTEERFVSRLAQTCRQMYFELETYPVFYRVNTFVWPSQGWGMLQFLAALTPQRRAFLRSLVLKFDGRDTIDRLNLWRLNKRIVEMHQHEIAMLSRCQDLRVLEIHCYVNDDVCRQNGTLTTQGRGILENLLELLGSSNELCIWTLPFLKPFLEFGHCYDPRYAEGFVIDLTNATNLKNPWIEKTFSNPSDAHLLKKVMEAVATHDEGRLAQEALGGGRLKITDAQIHAAIRASEVDFPGENRLHQDRFSDTVGHVSARTRQKCSKSAINAEGVIVRNQDKYDKEGMLTWNVSQVHDVRWKGSQVEVDVQGFSARDSTNNGNTPFRSWEKLEIILNGYAVTFLQDYYDALSAQVYWEDPVARLEEIHSKPIPKDISDITVGLVVFWGPPAMRSYRDKWRHIQTQYDLMIRRLEGAAAESKDKPAHSSNNQAKTKGRESKRKSGKPKK